MKRVIWCIFSARVNTAAKIDFPNTMSFAMWRKRKTYRRTYIYRLFFIGARRKINGIILTDIRKRARRRRFIFYKTHLENVGLGKPVNPTGRVTRKTLPSTVYVITVYIYIYTYRIVFLLWNESKKEGKSEEKKPINIYTAKRGGKRGTFPKSDFSVSFPIYMYT